MPTFKVRLLEPSQSVSERLVAAEHDGRVADALGVAPWRVLGVEEVRHRRPQSGRIDLRLASRQLAVLLDAGVPLLEALQTLREKTGSGSPLDPVIAGLSDGRSLSDSLALAPRAFDELFVAVVAASERSGQLGTTLRDHAAFLDWNHALRGRLVAAAVYPAMLLATGATVVVFLLLYVLPRFSVVFAGMEDRIPAASRWLMSASQGLHAHPVAAGGVLLAVLAALGVAWRHPAVRARLVDWVWRWPRIGDRLREVALARLYRCMSHLLSAGLPVLEALRLCGRVVPEALRPGLAGAITRVGSGLRLSQALEACGLATPAALRMVRVGESSGQLAAMLGQAASFHDEEIARLTEFVGRALNPLLMLLMGVLIGGVVVLMYLPIFTLMDQIQ